MQEVRLGIVGLGNMGASYAGWLKENKVQRCSLAAVCDVAAARLRAFGPPIAAFQDSSELIRSGLVDAVIITTPHYAHTAVGIDALKHGLHVLVEKPISVHKADCLRLIAAHRDRKQVFAVMFQERTNPVYKAVKKLITSGELGEIARVNWIITAWFRTEYYYKTAGWRATWAGEGGGVLMNQCPHQLDMLIWLTGLPRRVHGHCSFGKWHKIEVEDEVTAYLEYENGATGVFVASTGESPGTNRLEIAGERGRVVVEEGAVSFRRNTVPMSQYSRTAKVPFGRPEVWEVGLPISKGAGSHVAVLQNFVDAILAGAPLIAPAAEGMHSVELANAILYSSLKKRPVTLPLDAAEFERCLRRLIRSSRFRSDGTGREREQDISKSFLPSG